MQELYCPICQVAKVPVAKILKLAHMTGGPLVLLRFRLCGIKIHHRASVMQPPEA